MSDLADLAADVTCDMPPNVRKVIDTAIENGWQLNRPGMTIALRLNHPTDALADPVYVTWVVARTPSGKLSFRFGSCGTRGLVPLKGADLIEYLAEPTVIYPTPEEVAEADRERTLKKLDKAKWDTGADPVMNLIGATGAVVIAIERPKRGNPARTRAAKAAPPPSASTAPLRITAPKAR